MLTLMDVVSFWGPAIFGGIGGGHAAIFGGGHAPGMQAGAAAGITVGSGAAMAPVYDPAHAMLAIAATIRQDPRITIFLTIPSSSFRQTHYIRET
jgi:hypothetical protein